MMRFPPPMRSRGLRVFVLAALHTGAACAAAHEDIYVAGEAGAYERVATAIGQQATDAASSLELLSFATVADVAAFQKLSDLAAKAPMPDARQLAKALIGARLGIDGDAYTVAHFASPEQRAKGVPDQTTTLTEAVMQAFPDHGRHSLLAVSSDLIGGVFGGGRQSVEVVGFADRLWHGRSAKEIFATVGLFLWSRTGPGYVYNAFVAEGNVVQTVREDARPLDEAFGVFRAGGFATAHDSGLRLSQVVALFEARGTFAQLPYVAKLDDALDRYWDQVRADWPVLARYQFVQQARHARATGQLSEAQYRQAMAGGAPRVPLSGPIALAQLRDRTPATGVQVRRFDINGYTASDLVRFIAPDGSEVMYVPGGAPAFVVAGSERELRQWVLDQAKEPARMEALLGHFSTYRAQDGVFWTGVKQGLENLGSGHWQADSGSIDHANEPITDDVFQDMRAQLEARLREDAHMQVKTAWEGWRVTIGRWSALMLPLSFFPPVSLEVQILTTTAGLGTGIEQGIDGKTAEERKAGVAGALSTVVNTALIGGSMAGKGGEVRSESSGVADETPTFVAPRRVNGKLGYPLSPTTPPGWRTDALNRLYRLRDGTLSLWTPAQLTEHTLMRMPGNATPARDNMYVRNGEYLVRLGNRVARLVADGSGYRIKLNDGTGGPRVARLREGDWALAVDDLNYAKGSRLAQYVPSIMTSEPLVLHRAAEVLESFGEPESELPVHYGVIEPAEPARPLVTVALGHGFVETLPARLRDVTAVRWTPSEERLLAPHLAEALGRPLVMFSESGSLEWAVLPDGSDAPPGQLPPDALSVRRTGAGFGVEDRGVMHMPYRSLLTAVADTGRGVQSRPVHTAAGDGAFRLALADAVEAKPLLPQLERMHQLWLEKLRLPTRQVQALAALSRLRHAIAYGDPLSATQVQQLSEAGVAHLLDAGGKIPVASRSAAYEGLARLLRQEDALLPKALDHLVVTDPKVLTNARTERTDAWIDAGRHYVRLRHPDGRSQVVETAADAGGYREILAPGDGPERGTGRIVVEDGDRWLPETGTSDGFAPISPNEQAKALAAVQANMPATLEPHFGRVSGIVDSIPQPLLGFFSRSLTSVKLADDGRFVLTLSHPRSGSPLRYLTRVDIEGNPQPAHPAALPPVLQGPHAVDSQLILPVPAGVPGVRFGPSPDPANYMSILAEGRPVSAFIRAGLADRHVKALIATRRLRGMLREDAHVAVVAATPEHAVTLVMPVNGEVLSLVTPGEAGVSSIEYLPAGTVIVDEMFGVRSDPVNYATQVRRVAKWWEGIGAVIRHVRPDGAEVRESPVAFTERMLSEPLRPNLWNPSNDPISEQRYVEYMRRRYTEGTAVRHAGLDWLETREARRDYMDYFRPPYDVLSDGVEPPATDLDATRMYELSAAAIEASLRPIAVPVRASGTEP